MKTPHAIGLAAASVLIAVAIQESRIASLRTELESAQKATPASAAVGSPFESATIAGEVTPPERTKTRDRSEVKPAAQTKEAGPGEESMAKTARKIWDNPAGKSMMNQGVKIAVAMMYQDFIEGLELSKEEAEYFQALLGREMADQQEIGMKMMEATAEERKSLAEDLSQRAATATEDIKKFLNSEEDFKRYSEFKDRLPERQQIEGIRSAMTSKGAPIDAETESRLIDAMFKARTEAAVPDLQGMDTLEQIGKGNLAETFEKSWAAQQEKLGPEIGKILNPTQIDAFQEYQKQLREMQLMGIKMAEKMMPGEAEGGK
jgi:hypothetical protein